MQKKYWFYICGFLAGLMLVVAIFIGKLADGKLHVYFLDVGQGDAILLILPDGYKVLVDGGPDNKILRELTDVLPFYDKSIDLVILTHPHPDHINGLIETLKRYSVADLLLTGINYSYPGYQTFLELMESNRIRSHFLSGQEDFKIGKVLLDILFPLKSLQGRMFENVNNSSIVFRLIYGKEVLIFEGDLEKEGELKLLESGLDVSADFIKIGHHGSRTSSSENYLDRVGAKYAFILCGAGNSYLHPHVETLKKLAARGVRTWRTDLDGRIEVVSDGEDFQVLP